MEQIFERWDSCIHDRQCPWEYQDDDDRLLCEHWVFVHDERFAKGGDGE